MINALKETVNYLFWVFIIQGISYVLLGILIAANPMLLLILVIAILIWQGILSFVVAYKIRSHAKDLA